MHMSMHDPYRLHSMSSEEFRTVVESGYQGQGFYSALVTYTPALARDLFEARHKNRAISPRDQGRLEAVLQTGRWRMNGQSMIFCNCSNMLHGINCQNRLHACMTTGKELTSLTVWGVAFEDKETMDIGKKQSGADILAAHEVPDYSTVAAGLRVYYKLVNRGMRSTAVVLPDYEIVEYYKQHKSIHYSVNMGQKTALFLPPSIGTALHYLFTQHVKQAAEDKEKMLPDVLVTQLAKGEALTRRDPVYVLREFLGLRRTKDPRMSRRGTSEQENADLAAQGILTWNALRQRRQLTQEALRTVGRQPFPEIV